MQYEKNIKAKKLNKKTITKISLSIFFLIAIFLFSYDANNVSAACSYPSQILDLTNWKETLPTGSSENPTEIKQTLLSTFSVNPYFMANAACDGVTFRAPVNGVTTSGSGYPRSELREMTNNGTSSASWSTTSGAHSMTITQAINAVPKDKKHVVAGQIHDASDDIIVVRLEYPKLFIDINGTTGPTLDPNYTLGKKFTVQFVAAGGQIKIYYNGSQQPAYTMNKSGSGNYFKAGAYTQSNCSKESSCDSNNFGEVTIYGLKVQHQTSASTILISAPLTSASPSPTTSTSPTTITTTTTPTIINSASFEAESGIINAPMNIAADSLALNGKYIVQATDGSIGSAKYTFTIPNDGKYQLKSRVISPDGTSNSFNYSLDTGSFVTWSLPDTIKSWTWVEGSTLSLTKGTHTLTINNREKNTKIDSFEFKPIINTSITLEAESGSANGGMAILSDDATASNGKYIQANSSGSVVYAIKIIESGTYKIAGWIKAASTMSDSFYASIDGNSAATWSLPLAPSSWQYNVNDNNTFTLNAGYHILTLKYREAGAKIDKLMLLKQ